MKVFGLIILLFVISTNYVCAENTFDLDSITISASRSNEDINDINKNVSVITSEEIANSPQKSLPELLGAQAGVYGIKYGNIKNSQVDLGGFGETSLSNTLILVNGRRTNQIDLSGQDWSQIDLNSIERIEIIKGSGTVLYGDNADGGVINIVTKKGHKESKPSIALSNEIGSYQSQKHGFDLSGGTKLVDYQASFSHQEDGGFRGQSNYWANDLNTRLGFDPTDNFGVDFSQGYHLDRYQLPGALFLSNIKDLGYEGVRPSLRNDHGWTSDSHFDLTPRVKLDVGASDGEFSVFTSERRRTNKFFTGTTVYETMSEINSYEFQPKFVLSTPLDRFGNKFTIGFDEFYAKNERRSGYLGPSQDLVFITKSTHGVYLLDELTLDEKWLLNTGLRQTWAKYVFDQKAQISGKSWVTTRTPGYEEGIGYKYNANSKVYANYSHSYRLPAVDEFYQNIYDFGGGPGGGLNTNLTFQTGNEYQFGIKDNTFKNTKLGVNFSVSQFKNEIYLDPSTFNNTNYDGRTRHYTVSAEASREFWDNKIEPFINVTFQEAHFIKGIYDNNEIPFVPTQMAHTGVTFRPIDRLSTSISVDQIGERFAIADPTNTTPKLKRFATADWNIKYGFRNIDLWFSLNNLFDTKYNAYGVYSTFSADTGYYPAPGRNVNAGVKVKF